MGNFSLKLSHNAFQKNQITAYTDENGYPKFIIAVTSSVGETQIAAKLQATEAAKLDLAGQIATNVAALIENNIANSQLNTEEAASVTKTVAASKSFIAQELGRTVPLVEMYRNIGKNFKKILNYIRWYFIFCYLRSFNKLFYQIIKKNENNNRTLQEVN